MSKMTDDLTEWILSFASGQKWYGKLVSQVTKRIYLKNLKNYCDAVGKNPDELIQLKMEGLKHIGEDAEFQAETLLEKFLSTAKLTNDVKVGVKTSVISFYKHNRRHLEPDTASNIERGESKKRCPKIEDILELENAMTTQRDKALLWFIASAPFRLSSISKLKWNDLIPTGDKDVPYSMLIEAERLKGSGKGKYKGVKQIGFLHSLAVQKLEAYKKELERKGYTVSEKAPIFIAYRQKGKVKPFSPWTIEGMFTDASLNAWHDLDKKRFSPHDLRDFVQSQLENAGINVNLIKPMLAHKPKGVDQHYSEHDIKDFLEKFKTALPYLTPTTVGKVKAEHEIKLREQDAKMKWQEERIETLETRLTDNGLSINKIMTDFAQLKAMVEETERKKPEKVPID